PNLPVAVPYAAGSALPYHLPAIRANLKAITIVPGIIFVAHKTEEGHVNRSHSKLEGLEMQAEVLPKAVKDSQHPSSIF
ncbi:hypothetical protein NPN13_25210, partial [Vibrio parahaemolyticus]|nr:hypothetical protein [Vibrio parahaemolyticus]